MARSLIWMKSNCIRRAEWGAEMDKLKAENNMDLTVNLGGILMNNPVAVASGTFGYGREYEDYIDIASLGAVIVKGTTLEPRHGNPPPRIIETAAGMLNAIGLENPGVDVFILSLIHISEPTRRTPISY